MTGNGKEWLEMVGKGWWLRFQANPLWVRFMEWRIGRQSKKFAKELKRKNYVPKCKYMFYIIESC